MVEAMAAGLPVVSTLHAGIPTVIESERNGLLVRERDVDGLVSALQTLIDDGMLRARLGRAAADDARRVLDLDVCTARLERIYDHICRLTASPIGRVGGRPVQMTERASWPFGIGA